MIERRITVFTPTYNRGYILPRLYESLKAQTNKKFTWLIVDDGSSDNTKDLVTTWLGEAQIKIEYYFQENQGKATAHNTGVSKTKTELFVCVDSDDFLERSTIEEILNTWERGKQLHKAIGILAFKGTIDGRAITTLKDIKVMKTTLRDAYRRHGLKGDTMLVYKTQVIRKYSFPKFKGEKFVPEAYLYDQLDQEGELLVLRKVLYYCDYLDNGYSKNMTSVLAKNPEGYLCFIKQRLKLDDCIWWRILDSIRYVSMCMNSKNTKCLSESVYPIITFMVYPFGMLHHRIRYKKAMGKK